MPSSIGAKWKPFDALGFGQSSSLSPLSQIAYFYGYNGYLSVKLLCLGSCLFVQTAICPYMPKEGALFQLPFNLGDKIRFIFPSLLPPHSSLKKSEELSCWILGGKKREGQTLALLPIILPFTTLSFDSRILSLDHLL